MAITSTTNIIGMGTAATAALAESTSKIKGYEHVLWLDEETGTMWKNGKQYGGGNGEAVATKKKPNPNLLRGANKYIKGNEFVIRRKGVSYPSVWSSSAVTKQNNNYFESGIFDVWAELKPGKTYTLQVKCSHPFATISNNVASEGVAGFHLQTRTRTFVNDKTWTSSSERIRWRDIGKNSNSLILGNKVIYTFTAVEDKDTAKCEFAGQLNCRVNCDGTNDEVKFWDFKLEEGTEATEWTQFYEYDNVLTINSLTKVSLSAFNGFVVNSWGNRSALSELSPYIDVGRLVYLEYEISDTKYNNTTLRASLLGVAFGTLLGTSTVMCKTITLAKFFNLSKEQAIQQYIQDTMGNDGIDVTALFCKDGVIPVPYEYFIDNMNKLYVVDGYTKTPVIASQRDAEEIENDDESYMTLYFDRIHSTEYTTGGVTKDNTDIQRHHVRIRDAKRNYVLPTDKTYPLLPCIASDVYVVSELYNNNR